MSLEKFVKEHKTAFDDEKMPEAASLDFEARLKSALHPKETKVKSLKTIRYVSIAASVALLITFGYWYQNKQERIEMRDNLVLALGESDTNSSRLEAIYEIEDQFANEKEDEKILKAFFKILKADSDANSKIAVIDALLKFPDNQLVRNNLIEALGNETEPLVQLKLIKSVATLREQRAKAPLKKIIEDEEALPLVKGNASALLAMLNQ
ncbi:HEAT repeat domain-containing protein [uncultured Winogradskyella sp.]|uniref:HEAT repeat domain-containing protein n=1 Tax=uncultured Winogradskyella sp. TaxID=395353 RepID=UPI002620726C|nr:HEAT repeat domain-containing protein [uncultured Winogradskyella sp.]